MKKVAVSSQKTILVVGAGGFIGGFVVAALRERGHRVLRGVRAGVHVLSDDERAIDFSDLPDSSALRDMLQGVDMVVNAAGILRESSAQRFDAIHFNGPLELAKACVDAGVRRFVQISALGRVEDGPFIASKHRFDERLQTLEIETVVLCPSVVYSTNGSYGGTSLLRALAATPGAHFLPGSGEWMIQPVAVEDLADLVVESLDVLPGVYELGGPAAMSLGAYQSSWRRWLRIKGDHAIHMPEWAVDLQVALFERIGVGPLGATMWRMLKRGNVLSADALDRLQVAFGQVPRSLDDVLASRPSQVQDRWQAQLYFLVPLLRVALVVLWLISAWVGFAAAPETIKAMVGTSWLGALDPVLLARGGGVIDLILGLLLAFGWRTRPVLLLMALSVIAYSVVFGIGIPAMWFDPLGGLAKNLVILPAIAIAWVLVDRR